MFQFFKKDLLEESRSATVTLSNISESLVELNKEIVDEQLKIKETIAKDQTTLDQFETQVNQNKSIITNITNILK